MLQRKEEGKQTKTGKKLNKKCWRGSRKNADKWKKKICKQKINRGSRKNVNKKSGVEAKKSVGEAEKTEQKICRGSRKIVNKKSTVEFKKV